MQNKYEAEVCPYCGQSLTYEISIDKGSCETLQIMSKFIREKRINAVHLAKELVANGLLTPRQLDNIAKLKFNGLVANIQGEPGNYAITSKGLKFLGGARVPRSAIVKKGVKGQKPHVVAHTDELVGIYDLDTPWAQYWAINGFEIFEGRVIDTPPVKSNENYRIC